MTIDANELVAEVRHLRAELRAHTACVHQWRERFEPFLEKAVERETFWAKVRAEVVASSAKSFVWATLVAVAVGLWHLVLETMKRAV